MTGSPSTHLNLFRRGKPTPVKGFLPFASKVSVVVRVVDLPTHNVRGSPSHPVCDLVGRVVISDVKCVSTRSCR